MKNKLEKERSKEERKGVVFGSFATLDFSPPLHANLL